MPSIDTLLAIILTLIFSGLSVALLGSSCNGMIALHKHYHLLQFFQKIVFVEQPR